MQQSLITVCVLINVTLCSSGVMQMFGSEQSQFSLTRIAHAASSRDSAKRVGAYLSVSLYEKQSHIVLKVTFCNI